MYTHTVIPLGLRHVEFLSMMITLLGTHMPGDSSLALLLLWAIGLGVVEADTLNGEPPSPSN